MITPHNILRHELIGLKVEIVSSPNKSLVGIKGRVVDETRNMLFIETEKKVVKIPKALAVFLFHLDNCKVKVDGRLLIGRPEERLKKKIKPLYPY
ncbi:Ribonuclease P, Rpp29 [Methanocaldococcus infernus ME]|uniref:Ribonuclease P protein component 1 n=1 Tax=Methanocaldococcus infernus (strain DSM 11812 / JCM 15783 / ME) TaxID=573063 RepID=D5VRU4_METIM|nr:ribonuclease P protein component 1 [Methanocaldococcus infernus]ADG13297.1 Ribonuclease P, Rpp29 [Methanocaldococcus infernus ME]